MKKAINPQSQNEVKDLLNEYVVSPLNNDISQTLVQMKDEIEQLGDSTNAELKKLSPIIQENIRRLQKLLDFSFHFENEEDAFENISDDIEDAKGEITKKISSCQAVQSQEIRKVYDILEQLKSNLAQYSRETNDAIKGTNSAILSQESEHFSKLNELISELATKTHNIQELLNTVLSSEQSISSHLHSIEDLVSGQLSEISKNATTSSRDLSKSLSELMTVINDHHENTTKSIDQYSSHQTSLIEKKYKTLFTLLLSFGIVDTIGIITLLILYIIK